MRRSPLLGSPRQDVTPIVPACRPATLAASHPPSFSKGALAMSSLMQTEHAAAMTAHDVSGALLRSLIIGLTAFLTVVDLFATQAILPSLTKAYGVTPAAMGLAVNASTFGMAIASLAIGFLSPKIDRRPGVLVSLVLLSLPTALLASAPNITVFTALRIAHGLCMPSAFTLTLASPV